MKNILLLLLLSIFCKTVIGQWNNLIPNYSFEDMSHYPPMPETDGVLDVGFPFGDMQYISDYWAACAFWTHPLQSSVFCGGNPPVVTIYPTRSKGEYYMRCQGSLENGEYGEVGVVPIENAFNSAGTPVLNTANTYYIEFYFDSGTNKQLSFKGSQPSQCLANKNYGTVVIEFGNDNSVEYQPTETPYKWRKYRGFFKPQANHYKWMTVGSGGFFDDFKIYELDDNLCRNEWYFDNTVFPYPIEIYQASDFIIAGEGVDPESGALAGPVAVVEGSFTTFKAGNYIQLEPGFSVDVGSGALLVKVENQPCTDLCPTVNIPRSPMCVSGPTPIGDPNLEGTFKTVSRSPATYLDDPNSVNPIFTPPPGSGSQVYWITYDSDCFDNGDASMVTEAIVVNYTNIPNQQPVINVGNLVYDNYTMSANIGINDIISGVTISYIDKDGVNHESTYYRNGSIVNNVLQIDESFFSNVSCCADLEISVSAKTFCGDIIQTTIVWPKSGTFGLIGSSSGLPNIFTPDGDGVNDNLCIEVGALTCHYEIWVYNRYNNLIYNNSGPVTGTPLCMWDGTKNSGFPSGPNVFVSDGTYFYKIELSNDCGDIQILDELEIQVEGIDGEDIIVDDPTDPYSPNRIDHENASNTFEVATSLNVVSISSNNLDLYTAKIYDISGKLISEFTNRTNIQTELAVGIYVVKFFDKNATLIEAKKIVING